MLRISSTQGIINMRLFFIILFIPLTVNVFAQSENINFLSKWVDAEIINVEIINSESEEFSPMLWSNYLLYIGRQENIGLIKAKKDYFDIKASLLNKESVLTNFVFNTELNSKYHEGPLSWDSSNDKLYFTRANFENDKAVFDSLGRHLLQIYQAEYAHGGWHSINKLSFCKSSDNYCHPAIFKQGESIIFASTIPGGLGKMDLYKSEKISDDEWSKPINLGKQINNPGNDWFPFVYKNLLFYSTDVKDGKGLDIYLSEIDQLGNPGSPIRLPNPINSTFDDFGISISEDGSKVYFSSNRPGGKGRDDIYQLVWKTNNVEQTSNAEIETQNEITKAIQNPFSIKTNKDLRIQIKNSINNSGIPQSEIYIYIIPKNEAINFAHQIEATSNVEILESMANNIGSSISYVSDDSGAISINVPIDEHLFFVAKKDGYLPEWNYIFANKPIEMLGFELDRK